MILLVHMLFGSAVGYVVLSKTGRIDLAVTLAFFSHYFLDLFPHIEYPLPYIKNKNWKRFFPDILKVMLDFGLGLLTILIFSKNQPVLYAFSLAAIVPDGFTIITSLFPKFLARHNKIHTEKIHFLKYKKIPNFWRIATQVSAVIISITLLNL